MIKDANILLSTVNTYLRDKYSSLSALCEIEDYDYFELVKILKEIGYVYDENLNAFIKEN